MAQDYTPIGDVPLHSRYGLTSSNKSRLLKLTLGAIALVAVGSFAVSSSSISTVATPQPKIDVSRHTLRASGATVTADAPARVNASAFPGAGDEIVELHGKPESYTSRLFSGYLPIGNGGEAFYFFAESQSESAQSDPVLLWLNGGPGASSLAGCFSENGPLLVNDDGVSLRVNEYAWNQNANFVCIESPIGVGFSYNASGVYVSDDVKQADELYEALQQFLTKFPWLRSNDFIVSGESYGGVYVPMTAKRIVQGNENGDGPTINLKKFVVGNGMNEFMGTSRVVFAYYHGLIGTDEYKAIRSSCPELKDFEPSTHAAPSEECMNAQLEFNTNMYLAIINNYDIYAPCAGTPLDGVEKLLRDLVSPAQGVPHPIELPMSVCLNNSRLTSYFNHENVRGAMHTSENVAHWNSISLTSANIDLTQVLNVTDAQLKDILRTKVLQYTPTVGGVVTPLWKELTEHGVEGVIYHGDVDFACDFIGGLWAVESLQLPRQQPRSTWSAPGVEQTAGFLEDFGAIKYVTIKGAGHMVPTDKPREAKELLDRFILEISKQD
ncbi:hypothetical protein PINS_up000216 [Pythium insidiosum]|nr:hypothetical protein PINS_up000216 [Pythium insidiosum]